jgi:hypothetical protein
VIHYQTSLLHQASILPGLQGETSFTFLSNQLEAVILASMKRLMTKLAKLEDQRSSAFKAAATRRKADLLVANLHRCRQGQSIVVVSWRSEAKAISEVFFQPYLWPGSVDHHSVRDGQLQAITQT